LWPFLGPAFIAAVAYVDPGNFATNIAGGAKFGYLLLWVVLMANLMAMFVQSMSAKLGIAPQKRNHAALGFEYQVLDDEKASDRFQKVHQCGALYELFGPDDSQKKLNPVGEWNSSRIVFNGNHIEHWLNGKKIVEADLGSPQMNEALAKSKWKNQKDFGTKKVGHIVIQDHQDEAWFRNVKIRELPAAK
jgi:hypothetical protein